MPLTNISSCSGTFLSRLIYLHNLHKLLWRHITRFVPAFRRRSLPPVFPRGVGTATRRLYFMLLSEKHCDPVRTLMSDCCFFKLGRWIFKPGNVLTYNIPIQSVCDSGAHGSLIIFDWLCYLIFFRRNLKRKKIKLASSLQLTRKFSTLQQGWA